MENTLNDALIDCIKALGGSKQVGYKLWPEKTPDVAQRHLLDCLNPERPAKLSPEQVVFIAKLGRDIGHHGVINFMCGELGYSKPTPIEPKDEFAELARQILATQQVLTTQFARLTVLQPSLKD